MYSWRCPYCLEHMYSAWANRDKQFVVCENCRRVFENQYYDYNYEIKKRKEQKMAGYVDVVVGGQYGDEGKGQICAWLAHNRRSAKNPYHFAIRVGGSNAEHRFVLPDGSKHTARVLPVAAWIDPEILIVLGPGHMIRLDSFLAEVADLEELHGPQTGRIFIDPLAGVIDPETHVKAGNHKKTTWRGSTFQGNGQAVAHKVLRDGTFKTAKDYEELQQYVCKFNNTWQLLKFWLSDGYCGLLEGSQGALLSLNHGYYPFCTAKDVTPPALLAEAGLPIQAVRNVYAVYRTIPMRVPGNSGPTGGKELTWKQLEEYIGKSIPESVKHQTDSGKRERIFLWSWEDFSKSIHLCGPTHLVLTFADWWPTKLMASRGHTLEKHISSMSAIAGAPVFMVRHGPEWGDFKLLGGEQTCNL